MGVNEMATRGRKRKTGKRTASGVLSRAGRAYDKGSERAEWKQSIYGADGSDALGRAYVMGLLGEHGQTLLATGRAIARAYWPIFGTGRIGCTLGGATGGGGDGNLAQEQWLSAQLATINALGHDYRRAFDSLVIDINADEGPAWLDRLIDRKPQPADQATLYRAIFALNKLAA
jgi:hypothetical protein